VPRPTLLLKYAESSDGFLSWRWSDRLAEVEAAHIGAEVLAAVREGLAGSLPNPLPGESTGDAIARALTSGGFARPDLTTVLCSELGMALVPQPLWTELAQAPERPVIRLQPSPSLAQVPWELVLLEVGDVVITAPASVGPAPGTGEGHGPQGPVVAVVDPRIPGQAADSALGSVLGRPHADSPLAELITRHGNQLRPVAASYADLVRRQDLDRTWLREACRAAERLLFVGHTTSAADDGLPGENSALHLCDVDADGRPLPLTAGELITGTGTGPWRLPSRVALLGCESGGDARDVESLGLVLAALHCGADLVTATRWVLPTDRALAEAAGTPLSASPLQELVLAVDAAHSAAAPLEAVAAWRQDRARTWQSTGALADSPLLWAAVSTTCRPGSHHS